MARGATLAELIIGVQDEITSSSLPSLGQNFREIIKSRIRREYNRLFEDFAWPHLSDRWVDQATAAGQRYYDIPATFTLETVDTIHHKWGNLWHPLYRGIAVEDYNAKNSDLGYRSDPALKWRPYGQTQIELWPVPSAVSTLRWVGKALPNPLVDESDICDLDDNLVILFAAAKLLQRRGADEAQLVLAEANAHYATLKKRSQTGEDKVNFATGAQEGPALIGFRDKIIVGVPSSQT